MLMDLHFFYKESSEYIPLIGHICVLMCDTNLWTEL